MVQAVILKKKIITNARLQREDNILVLLFELGRHNSLELRSLLITDLTEVVFGSGNWKLIPSARAK